MSIQGEPPITSSDTVEAAAQPGRREQRLGLRGIEAERPLVAGAEDAVGHEALVDDARAAQEALGDAVIVDEIFERRDHRGRRRNGLR